MELFTGGPRRGIVPVLLDISPLQYSEVVNDRVWLEKADWASWTKTVEELSEDVMEINGNHETSHKFIPTKNHANTVSPSGTLTSPRLVKK